MSQSQYICHSGVVTGQLVIQGDRSASVCSPEAIRSKHACSHRGVLTRSPTRTPPEP